jgi:hypothetical protein
MARHIRTSTVRRRLRRLVLGTAVIASVLSMVNLAQPSGASAVGGDEQVVSGTGTDLSAWRGNSAAGPVQLGRVDAVGRPGGAATAVEVSRTDGTGDWTVVLARLHNPASWFEVGRTYRMQAYVRDMAASGGQIGMLLANGSYRHRPTRASRYATFTDTSWHLLTRTFVATAPASTDTALYFGLPGSGALHWQITAASVREVDPFQPPTVSGPPSRVLSFDGPAGTAPDPAEWNHDLGAGWGNGELQTYTADTANAAVDGAGNLVITARRDETGYTSARLNTKGKVSVAPGSYLETSIRAPAGTGVWSAFWLLGDDIDEVGWPASGELDVLEVLGSDPTVALSATHQAAAGDPTRDLQYGWDEPGATVDLGEPLDRATHTYGVYFDVDAVRFYIDRRERMTITAAEALASGRTWPFDKSFFVVLNVAVGGMDEDPATTTFPRSMTVGAISIWQGGTPF